MDSVCGLKNGKCIKSRDMRGNIYRNDHQGEEIVAIGGIQGSTGKQGELALDFNS